MTDKKHHRHNEQADDALPGAAEAAPNSDHPEQIQSPGPVESELDSLKQRLADVEGTAAQNLDGWQRAVAEFQNYKKRIERDREAEQAGMKGDLIKKVLPVLDDLERALQNRPAEDAWTNGIELIRRKLQSIIEAEGAVRIEAMGEAFDPRFHEAISYEPVDGVESGHVLEVVQNGYMIGERVIRPAVVRVAR